MRDETHGLQRKFSTTARAHFPTLSLGCCAKISLNFSIESAEHTLSEQQKRAKRVLRLCQETGPGWNHIKRRMSASIHTWKCAILIKNKKATHEICVDSHKNYLLPYFKQHCIASSFYFETKSLFGKVKLGAKKYPKNN